MDKISVIVPVYKVEKYLRKCLDSIVEQTYPNLEIIIIDDGSPDRCGEICDEYARGDKRVRVVHKKNGGLSAARNDGIQLATGEWISFVDSDDWCELDMYERVMNTLEDGVDVIMFSLFKDFGEQSQVVSAFANDFVTDDAALIEQMETSIINQFYRTLDSRCQVGFPWNRLFKTSLIQDNGITFSTTLKVGEDGIFNLDAFHYVKKMQFVDIPLYHYRFNPASICNRYMPNRPEVDNQVYEVMEAAGREYGLSDEYFQALNNMIVDYTAQCGRRCFFHREAEGSLMQKIKRANQVLHSDKVYHAFDVADRRRLSRLGKIITLSRHHNVLLLYLVTRTAQILKYDPMARRDAKYE